MNLYYFVIQVRDMPEAPLIDASDRTMVLVRAWTEHEAMEQFRSLPEVAWTEHVKAKVTPCVAKIVPIKKMKS